jgi:hypothetical protein
MQRRYATRAAILAAFTAAAMGAAQSSQADPITVTVNGSPVNFTGTPPMERNNSVLVPLRGVFEAMGASVDYNAVARTINAKKGSSYVVLPLGGTEATVNGQTETLSQPAAVVNGTTLVPLRFVAEALGAYVDWRQATSTVAIQTGEPHLATLPAPHGRTVTGQLTGIYTNTVPEQITLRVNGQNTAIPISPDTIVLRSEPDQPGVQVRLDQLSVGDQVTVQRDTDGTALSIAANYGEVHGTLKSVGRLANGDRVLTLNDGTTVELAPDARVTMDGRKVELGDILPDEAVRISTNPSNSLGFHVYVNPEGPTGGRHNNGPAPSVTGFNVDARGPVRDGEKLVATLTGTPGGQATFSIPGVVDAVPMNEVSPGVYRGSYTVLPGLSVQNASVLGRLEANGQVAPLIQANSAVSIQSVAPKISAVSPAKGSTVQTDRPLIYGTISDSGGAGIDPNKTQVMLDGHDVSADATVTPQFFNLRPSHPLQPGDHTVRVTVADGAGNTTQHEWTFRVSSEKFVKSFTSDADPNAVLNAGSRIRFTLNAQPGGQASVSVPGIAEDVPLRETSPGVYTGSYTVAQGQNASGVPATARFVGPNGDIVTQTLSQGLQIAAGQPVAPIITEPADGANVGRTVTVRGKAAPGATVRVKVNYTSSGLGGLLNLNGSAGTQEVTADDHGVWEVTDLPLKTDSLLANAGATQYQIVATTVNAAGESSPETALDVRGGRVYAHRKE